MKQLVQLRDAYAKLKQLDTEIIGVFREEKQGREGLTKIRNSTKVKFALVEDLKAEKTGQYSRFYNYVIDKQGVVQAIVPGTLKDRGSDEELLKAVKAIEKE